MKDRIGDELVGTPGQRGIDEFTRVKGGGRVLQYEDIPRIHGSDQELRGCRISV
jgi:hypothetical protein